MVQPRPDQRLHRYIKNLALPASREPATQVILSTDDAGREIVAVVFGDYPERGYVTGFTYGLSLLGDLNFPHCGRELVMTIRSANREWGIVPSRLAASLQGRHPFRIGQAIGYAGSLVDGTTMNSVLLAEPTMPGVPSRVDLGDEAGGASDVVEIVGVYPIYASERDRVYAFGFDVLWALDWDRFDPQRPAIVWT